MNAFAVIAQRSGLASGDLLPFQAAKAMISSSVPPPFPSPRGGILLRVGILTLTGRGDVVVGSFGADPSRKISRRPHLLTPSPTPSPVSSAASSADTY